MDNSIFVLIGTVIGGLITVLVTLINSRKEISLKETEFKLREKELELSDRSEFRKEKIVRYSKFSGSLQVVLGFLGDVIDIYQQDRESNERKQTINEIIDHPHYEEATNNLNQEMSWISIVTDSNEVFDDLCKLENEFDEFMGYLAELKTKEITPDKIQAIVNRFEQIKQSQRDLIKLLQNEIKNSI